MGILCLGLGDDFDLIIPQTQATASLSSQLSFVFSLHLIFKHANAFPKQMRALGWRQKEVILILPKYIEAEHAAWGS